MVVHTKLKLHSTVSDGHVTLSQVLDQCSPKVYSQLTITTLLLCQGFQKICNICQVDLPQPVLALL